MKASKGAEPMLRSSPPRKASQGYVDDFETGASALKSGRPRTSVLPGNSVQMTDAAEDADNRLLPKKGAPQNEEINPRDNRRYRRAQGH